MKMATTHTVEHPCTKGTKGKHMVQMLDEMGQWWPAFYHEPEPDQMHVVIHWQEEFFRMDYKSSVMKKVHVATL
jgi:hypothetical protein